MKSSISHYLQKKVQPRMLIFLLASLLLLPLTAAYLYVLKKPYTQYRKSQQTLSLLENELQTGLSLSNLIASKQQNIAQLDKQLYGSSQQLPINQIIAFVIGELDLIADKHKVKLISVKPGKLENRHIFHELPFIIELSGPYIQLYEWLNDVENSLGPIVVKQFEISPENTTAIRKMQLTIVSYRFEKQDL
jgi:Tfp pilus assembly protein PilO